LEKYTKIECLFDRLKFFPIITPIIPKKLIFIFIFIFIRTMAADINTLWAVLGTIVTVLGSASAWRFYEKRAMHKERDEDFIRHDCKDRISKLEGLLEAAGKEKDEMRSMILDLTRQVAELRVTVDFLRTENVKLVSKTPSKRIPKTK
jgi:hypothetical protein